MTASEEDRQGSTGRERGGSVPPREAPRTSRGLRTRAALVAAARTVFERDGYTNARLTDITLEAQTATGSFYTYFSGKEDIFAAVLEDAQEKMLHLNASRSAKGDDPVESVRVANRLYLEAYERDARLMRLLEEVAIFDDGVRALRLRRTAVFAERNAKAIRDLQSRGLADPSIDPLLAANALSYMVARMAYAAFVNGEPWSVDDLVDTLTQLWVNALRIGETDRPSSTLEAERSSSI